VYKRGYDEVTGHDQLQLLADEGGGKVRLRLTVGICTLSVGHNSPALTSHDDLVRWLETKLSSFPGYVASMALDRLSDI
jgi:hypothetical protein